MARNQTSTSVPGAGIVQGVISRIGTWWRERNQPPEKHSKDGEDVTDWEAYVMTSDLPKIVCPDCFKGRLREGPSGGSAVNAFCDLCPATFVFVEVLPDRKVWGTRLPNRETQKVSA
jgi:hypothetical protein